MTNGSSSNDPRDKIKFRIGVGEDFEGEIVVETKDRTFKYYLMWIFIIFGGLGFAGLAIYTAKTFLL